jgi:hypothetical protein
MEASMTVTGDGLLEGCNLARTLMEHRTLFSIEPS